MNYKLYGQEKSLFKTIFIKNGSLFTPRRLLEFKQCLLMKNVVPKPFWRQDYNWSESFLLLEWNMKQQLPEDCVFSAMWRRHTYR